MQDLDTKMPIHHDTHAMQNARMHNWKAICMLQRSSQHYLQKTHTPKAQLTPRVEAKGLDTVGAEYGPDTNQ
jgi:hypothetical protein